MTPKNSLTTALLIAALARPVSAFAQTTTAPSPSMPPAAAAPRAAAQKIGSVDELVLNPDGKVADVVIGVGGFLGAGEKRVAVPMAELKRGKNDHFVLAATKDSLKQMATFELKTASIAGSGSSAHK